MAVRGSGWNFLWMGIVGPWVYDAKAARAWACNRPFEAMTCLGGKSLWPSRSVSCPPASVMMGNIGAMSQGDRTGSIMISARPVATRR